MCISFDDFFASFILHKKIRSQTLSITKSWLSLFSTKSLEEILVLDFLYDYRIFEKVLMLVTCKQAISKGIMMRSPFNQIIVKYSIPDQNVFKRKWV